MKLYRMIIGDDERVILDSLMKYVDWKSLGFEVVALVEDGKEAIDILKAEKIDVVLCDIMMHEVSGLDVAEYVSDEKLDCEIVLLSGYQDFDYARRAISYNVNEYLLKPINLSTVESVFRKIKEKLDTKYQKKQERLIEQEKMAELQQGAVLKMIEMCKVGMLQTEKLLEEYLESFGVSQEILEDYLNELCINIPDSVKEDSFVKEVLENVFMLLQKKYCYQYQFVQYTDSNFEYSILILSEEPLDEIKLMEFHKELQSVIHDVCGAMAGVQQVITNMKFCEYLLSAKSEFIQENELYANDQEMFIELFAKQMLIVLHMSPEFKQIEEIVNQMLESELMSSVNSASIIKTIVEKMRIYLSEQTGIKDGTLSQDDLEIKGTKEDFTRILKFYHEMIHGKDETLNNLQKLTRDYIIEHISENVSLREAANNCFLSQNYFCRLFKEQTGEKYSEFYIRIKMEYAAKMLVKTRKKIYEISDFLGYKNVKYFFKLFKRIYNCTPTEYRNNMMQQDMQE